MMRENCRNKRGDWGNASLCFALALLFTPLTVIAAETPYGLQIVDEIQSAGSDARAKDFKKNHLKFYRSLTQRNLAGPMDSTHLLDPGKIRLQTEADARVYFVRETSWQHNTLGFNSQASGVAGGDPLLIFPDASTRSANYNKPLKAGDFVELGSMDAGAMLDFFLIADGANGGSNVFSTDNSVNPDGMRFAMTHARVEENSPYLLVAFEDQYGSNSDYNDLVFALDIGAANVSQLVKTIGAPEPSTLVSLAAMLTVGAGWIRRKRRRDL